jgi:hypothetical protein
MVTSSGVSLDDTRRRVLRGRIDRLFTEALAATVAVLGSPHRLHK